MGTFCFFYLFGRIVTFFLLKWFKDEMFVHKPYVIVFGSQFGFQGVIEMGGMGNIWELNQKHGRLNFFK